MRAFLMGRGLIIKVATKLASLSFPPFSLKNISPFLASAVDVVAPFILLLLIVANCRTVHATVEKSHVRVNSAEVTLQLG